MSKPRLLAVAAFSLVAAVSTTAGAQSIIKNPGDHPNYKVELEPHLDFGWANLYASNGFGAGFRAGIPTLRRCVLKEKEIFRRRGRLWRA